VQSDQQQEAEGGGVTFPSRLQWRRGHSQQHSTGAAQQHSGGAPLPSAATHKGRDLSLNPRDPAQHLNWGKRPPPFLTQSSLPGVLLAFFGPAPPAAKQVRRPTLVATASGAVLARSLVYPSTLPLKPPARLLCCLY